MQRIDWDDGFIELEIALLYIEEVRSAGTGEGMSIRPGKDRFRMEVARAIAPVKRVEAEDLLAAIGKGNVTRAAGEWTTVAGRREEMQNRVRGRIREREGAGLAR